MPNVLVLVGALLLASVGGWGLYQLLGRLVLSPAERLALMLALLPASLGLAAFGGLLAGRPGPMLPAVVCVALAALGGVAWRRPHPPTAARREYRLRRHPSPARRGGGLAASEDHSNRHESQLGADRKRACLPLSAPRSGLGGEVSPVYSVAVAAVLYALGTLGTMLLTPLSGGALRIGDWVAHWFLVLVYAGQPLPDLRVFVNRVGDFGVISRPPLYNLEGGLLVGALVGGGDAPFWPFQLITPLLALPLVAAGVLWAHAIGGPRAAWVFAGLAGLSPFLLQNASYPWSKMVAAALVLLFLYLIRAAALACQTARARQAFVLAALCAGLAYLAHPTGIFYILPTLLWLAWRRPRSLFRRPVTWTLATWMFGGLAGLVAFGPWQAWVLATYGLQATLDANPASFGADVSDTLADWLLKGAVAAVGTVVPLPALTAVLRGAMPTLDQVLRVQLALLTGAFGVSGCWVLVRASQRALTPQPPLPHTGRGGDGSPSPAHGDVGVADIRAAQRRELGGEGILIRWLRRPPWLALVVVCGFLGQVMLQPNWHDTGDAAESMTPVVVLGMACIAREALRLGAVRRRVFLALVLAELTLYLGLWLTWAFGAAWTRDPNAVLASRYGLAHLRGLWEPAVPLGALLLASGLTGSTVVLWRALTARPVVDAQQMDPADAPTASPLSV